jgi:hypothetical protein
MLLVSVLAVLVALGRFPGSRVNENALVAKRMGELRRMGMELRGHVYDQREEEKDWIKGKSVEQLVEKGVLSPADAAYIREHQIVFHGYDPNQESDRTPVLEEHYPLDAPRYRIVLYGDLHVASTKMDRIK